MNKRDVIKRFMAFLLCATVALTFMPLSLSPTIADETSDEVTATVQQTDEKPSGEETKPKAEEETKKTEETVVTKEEPVSTVDKEPEPVQAKDVPVTENADSPKDESALNEENTASDSAELVAEPMMGTQELKVQAVSGPLTVVFHMYSWDENGEYTVVKDVKKTVTEGNRLYLTTGTASYVPNPEVEINGKLYKKTATWKADDGSTVAGTISMTYDQVADLVGDSGTVDINYYVIYRTDVTLSLYFKDIKHADGTTTEDAVSETIPGGNGKGFSKKTIESVTGLRSGQNFSYAGYEYKYTGEWKDEDGHIFDASKTITFYNREGESSGNNYYISEDTTITLYPVWETKMVQGLDYHYIDNISTGSGSWSNKDAFEYRSKFDSLTHIQKPRGRVAITDSSLQLQILADRRLSSEWSTYK